MIWTACARRFTSVLCGKRNIWWKLPATLSANTESPLPTSASRSRRLHRLPPAQMQQICRRWLMHLIVPLKRWALIFSAAFLPSCIRVWEMRIAVSLHPFLKRLPPRHAYALLSTLPPRVPASIWMPYCLWRRLCLRRHAAPPTFSAMALPSWWFLPTWLRIHRSWQEPFTVAVKRMPSSMWAFPAPASWPQPLKSCLTTQTLWTLPRKSKRPPLRSPV